VFERLSRWLRANGMAGELRPVHALRKEFGSAINESFGIYAASRALRHANLPITELIYIDSRGSRPTTGLDRSLASAGDA
jgi:integrase